MQTGTQKSTYEEVCNFDTKHAECVKVIYSLRFHIPKRVIGRIF